MRHRGQWMHRQAVESWASRSSEIASTVVEAPQAAALALTVLLPAYNERLAITRVLGEVVESLAGEPIDYEILVVDDGSTDSTADEAEAFAQELTQRGVGPSVRVVRCPLRRGAGAARKVGIRAA